MDFTVVGADSSEDDAPPEPPHRFFGYVTTNQTETVSGAKIVVLYQNRIVASDRTNSSGYYDLKIPEDKINKSKNNITLQIRNTTATRIFKTGGSDQLNFTVTEQLDHRFFGVVNSTAGDVIEGLQVTAQYRGHTITTATSNASGFYEVVVPGEAVNTTQLSTLRISAADTNTTVSFVPGGNNRVDITVSAQANFTVEINSATSSVGVGDELNVTATITNADQVPDTQTVSLLVNGTSAASTSVSLPGNTSKTVTLSWNTTGVRAGTYTLEVTTLNDSAQTTAKIRAPANFTLNITNTNEPIVAGDKLNVTVTVTNLGDLSSTQQIALDIGGTQQDAQTVSLNGSKSRTITLSWATAPSDAGNYTAIVASENDTASSQITVQAPGNLTVSINSTNSPVIEESVLNVNVTVTNTGGSRATQNVTLVIDGKQRETRQVSLDTGKQTTVTLAWATTAGDAGNYTATVATGNDTDSVPVRVRAPANFTVSIDNTNVPVVEGETLLINATITNAGDIGDTQLITLVAGGAQRDGQTVSLNGSKSRTITLSWITTSGDAGNYTATVASENDTASSQITVQAPGNLTVSINSTNSPVIEGDTLIVNATITNTGGANVTQNVTLIITGQQRDGRQVSLGPGNQTVVTLAWTTTSGAAGNYTATVATGNDTDSVPVRVQAPANFTVAISSTTSPVLTGDDLNVTVTVTNTGDLPATQNITLTVNGSPVASTPISLAGNASTTTTLTWPTAAGDAGNYTLSVQSANDSAQTAGVVNEPANLTVRIAGVTDPVPAGQPVNVTANLTNTGDVATNQTITLTVNGTRVDAQSVHVDGNNATTLTLSWNTTIGTAGLYTLTVASPNDSASTTVTVQQPANITISDLTTNSPIPAGDQLSVTATVENTGSTQATQTLALIVNGTKRDATPVTLAGGTNRTVTLTWNTSSRDHGTYTATVAVGNRTARTEVTIRSLPRFNVTIDSTNSPVVEGDSLIVNATVTNTGDLSGTQTVRLTANRTQVAARTVQLNASESTTIRLVWLTNTSATGTYTLSVVSANDTASTTATIRSLTRTITNYVVTQGNRTINITPLSSTTPIESFYAYNKNGALSPNTGFEQNDTTRLFLYDGPNGTNLIFLHDAPTGNTPGSITLSFTNLPPQASWIRDATDPGDTLTTNSATWEWLGTRADGGILQGGFDQDFNITLAIANESGITTWELLSGPLTGPDVTTLNLTQPITITRTTVTKNDTSTAKPGDVNRDGLINTGDVIQVQRSIVGLPTDPAFSPQAADVNSDGSVNTGDVIQIQRFIVGLSSVLD